MKVVCYMIDFYVADLVFVWSPFICIQLLRQLNEKIGGHP